MIAATVAEHVHFKRKPTFHPPVWVSVVHTPSGSLTAVGSLAVPPQGAHTVSPNVCLCGFISSSPCPQCVVCCGSLQWISPWSLKDPQWPPKVPQSSLWPPKVPHMVSQGPPCGLPLARYTLPGLSASLDELLNLLLGFLLELILELL